MKTAARRRRAQPPQAPAKRRKSGRLQALLAACGIAGPLLYATAALVLGLLRPGYDHATQLVSELGEVGAPSAFVMSAAFFLCGLLLIAFAFGLYRGTSGGPWSKVGSVLLALGGLGFIGASFVPCSPGCPPPAHGPAAAIGAVGPFAPLAFWWSLRKDVQWRGYGSYSLATAVLVVPIAIAGLAGATKPWDGLSQRVWTGILFLWIIVMALHLLRLTHRPEGEDPPAS